MHITFILSLFGTILIIEIFLKYKIAYMYSDYCSILNVFSFCYSLFVYKQPWKQKSPMPNKNPNHKHTQKTIFIEKWTPGFQKH